MKVKVKNLNGSSKQSPKPTCKCENWLKHWENNKNIKAATWCRSCGETKAYEELNGGHIIKINSKDKDRYIVPLCDVCNGKDDLEFCVEENDLVQANCDLCKNK